MMKKVKMSYTSMFQMAEINNCRTTQDFEAVARTCKTSTSDLSSTTRIFRTMKYNMCTEADYKTHTCKVREAADYYGLDFNSVIHVDGAVTIARTMEIHEDLEDGMTLQECQHKYKFKSPSYVAMVKKILEDVSNSSPLKSYLFESYKYVIQAAELIYNQSAVMDTQLSSLEETAVTRDVHISENNTEAFTAEEAILSKLEMIYQCLYDIASMIASKA